MEKPFTRLAPALPFARPKRMRPAQRWIAVSKESITEAALPWKEDDNNMTTKEDITSLSVRKEDWMEMSDP